MLTISKAISDFHLAKEADGLAPKTLEWYKYGLSQFGGQFGHLTLETVTTHEIRRWIVDLRKRYSESTANDYIRQCQTFWKWCCVEYGFAPNPMRNVKYASPPKLTIRKAVESTAIEKFLNHKDDSQRGVMDRAIVAILWETTIRSQGLRQLKPSDIQTDGSIVIVEKNRPPRHVFITTKMMTYITEWMNIRAQAETLFYNFRTLKPYTSDGLRSLLKRFAKRVGLNPENVSTHFFRHGSGIQLLENGMDISNVSKIMGHTKIETTVANYLIYDKARLRKAHLLGSPSRYLKLRRSN
jgi:site-specific recombinase XerD